MRRRHRVFRRRRWFQGRPIHGSDVTDVGWFRPDGSPMDDEDWRVGFAKSLGVFLNGAAIPKLDERGERAVDDSFYLMFNAHHEPLEFVLPEAKWGQRWSTVLDTNETENPVREDQPGPDVRAGDRLQVQAWSAVLLRRHS